MEDVTKFEQQLKKAKEELTEIIQNTFVLNPNISKLIEDIKQLTEKINSIKN